MIDRLRIVVLGGYGFFGKKLLQVLSNKQVDIYVAGRNIAKAKECIDELANKGLIRKSMICTPYKIDVDDHIELRVALQTIKPNLVINTCGPFQGKDHTIAKTCLSLNINYMDLSDSRSHVKAISDLNEQARLNDVFLIGGVSSVPALSSAVADSMAPCFSSMNLIKYGICPGHKTERGIATIKAVLSYCGQTIVDNLHENNNKIGWLDLEKYTFKSDNSLSARYVSNCEIPDIDLLPPRYNGCPKIEFKAGMEIPVLQRTIGVIAWLIHKRVLSTEILIKHAKFLKRMSESSLFDGTDKGGMFVIIKGMDLNNQPLTKTWELVALDNDGPFVPVLACSILVSKLISGQQFLSGAYPCCGLVSLDDFAREIEEQKLAISMTEVA